MTCKDCILEPKCILRISYSMGDDETTGKELTDIEKRCKSFKNKADFVEVKHGKWIYNVKYYSCSICAGKRFNLLLGTDAEYCPYCGAKMDSQL